MSPDLAIIDRLAVTWRAAGDGWPADTHGEVGPDRSRLDRLTHVVVDGLEDALRDAGVTPEDEVCIRRLTVPDHEIRWDDPDDTIVGGWSRSIADALAWAVDGAESDDRLVRYRSTGHAVVDVVVRAVRHDLSRSWAWHQLGLWPTEGAVAPDRLVDHLVALLLDEPVAIVPAVASLARYGELASFVGWTGWSRVERLAWAAWAGAGGSAFDLESTTAAAAMPEWITIRAAAIVRRSTIASVGDRVPGVGSSPEGAEPQQSESAAGAVEPPAGRASASATALALLAILEVEPSTVGSAASPDLVSAVARDLIEAPTDRAAPPPNSRTVPAVARPGAQPASDGAPPTGEATAAISPAGDGPTAPEPARTEWGGLLFLLNIVPAAGLLDRLSEDSILVALGSPVALHRIAVELVRRAAPGAQPPPPTDPALLAFAGLPPDAEVPVPMTPGPTGTTEAIAAEADRLTHALAARLAPEQHPQPDEPALLYSVCRRRATIDAEPGWIDVLLDIEQVDPSVRRAGLDLDPGYLPWLGCVVRYRYG